MLRTTLGFLCVASLTATCDNRQAAKTPQGTDFQGKSYQLSNVHDWTEKRAHLQSDRIWISPSEGTADTFRENVSVTVENAPVGLEPEAYLRRAAADLNEIHRGSTLEYKPTTINGIEARMAHIRLTLGAVSLAVDSYVIVDAQHVYVITCTATQESYDRYRPLFTAMLRTFALESFGTRTQQTDEEAFGGLMKMAREDVTRIPLVGRGTSIGHVFIGPGLTVCSRRLPCRSFGTAHAPLRGI